MQSLVLCFIFKFYNTRPKVHHRQHSYLQLLATIPTSCAVTCAIRCSVEVRSLGVRSFPSSSNSPLVLHFLTRCINPGGNCSSKLVAKLPGMTLTSSVPSICLRKVFLLESNAATPLGKKTRMLFLHKYQNLIAKNKSKVQILLTSNHFYVCIVPTM